MTLHDDLKNYAENTFQQKWTTRNGIKVPEDNDIKLGNDGVYIEGTCLYADLARSTHLVKNYHDYFAAEIYKSFLYCASKIIRSHGGSITAFDGDRVMAVYIGDFKCTNAAKTALKINYAVKSIINPAILTNYKSSTYKIEHAVGIDMSKMLVAKTGIRGSNDLIWIGNSANYAAKLCAIREDGYNSYITKNVYDVLSYEAKYGGVNNTLMWEERHWKDQDLTVYRSNWWWKPD